MTIQGFGKFTKVIAESLDAANKARGQQNTADTAEGTPAAAPGAEGRDWLKVGATAARIVAEIAEGLADKAAPHLNEQRPQQADQAAYGRAQKNVFGESQEAPAPASASAAKPGLFDKAARTAKKEAKRSAAAAAASNAQKASGPKLDPQTAEAVRWAKGILKQASAKHGQAHLVDSSKELETNLALLYKQGPGNFAYQVELEMTRLQDAPLFLSNGEMKHPTNVTFYGVTPRQQTYQAVLENRKAEIKGAKVLLRDPEIRQDIMAYRALEQTIQTAEKELEIGLPDRFDFSDVLPAEQERLDQLLRDKFVKPTGIEEIDQRLASIRSQSELPMMQPGMQGGMMPMMPPGGSQQQSTADVIAERNRREREMGHSSSSVPSGNSFQQDFQQDLLRQQIDNAAWANRQNNTWNDPPKY